MDCDLKPGEEGVFLQENPLDFSNTVKSLNIKTSKCDLGMRLKVEGEQLSGNGLGHFSLTLKIILV